MRTKDADGEEQQQHVGHSASMGRLLSLVRPFEREWRKFSALSPLRTTRLHFVARQKAAKTV